MAIINKGYNRIPYIVIGILLFLTSWFIAAVYTWSLLAHITIQQVIDSMGLSTIIFAWVRSFITVFIAVVDVIYIGVGYNKTFGMRLPGGIWQSFSDMLARLFDKVGNSQVVTLQQMGTLNIPDVATKSQHNTQQNPNASSTDVATQRSTQHDRNELDYWREKLLPLYATNPTMGESKLRALTKHKCPLRVVRAFLQEQKRG